jgi:hypothetical protein
MNKRMRILAAVAFAGLATASGAAFTATGLNDTTSGTQFLGGTVHQTVTGADLVSVVYGYTDLTNTEVNSIVLTFANANGETVTVTANGGTPGADFVDAVNAGVVASNTVTFTNAGFVGLTDIDINVASHH